MLHAIMEAPLLCDFCQGLIKKLVDRNKDGTITALESLGHLTVESLVASSESRCTICTVLWTSLTPTQQAVVASPHKDRDSITLMIVRPFDHPSDAVLRIKGSWELTVTISSERLEQTAGEITHPPLMFVLLPRAGTRIPGLSASGH